MKVHIIMGSISDADVGRKAQKVLDELEIDHATSVASAHRTPEFLAKIVASSSAEVFIAIAGLSAALPGSIAAMTTRPVIGVPVSGKVNLDSILSVTQMPPGIPVAAVGLDRGDNAAILAAEVLALKEPAVLAKLQSYRSSMRDKVIAQNDSPID